MGIWTDTVEKKARIIHGQLVAAQALAQRNGHSADEVVQPYLDLLRSLYQDEYAFAQLADSSDLVARFTGPAVSRDDPTVTIVTNLFTDLRDQIRGIAKSIVGLSHAHRLRWPSELDPHLSGVTHGSLVVGISIARPSDDFTAGQADLPGISEQIFYSVREAVRNLSVIAHYVGEKRIDEEIVERFPDPAIRDTVLVAISNLAPSGRRGIDSLSLYGPDQEREPPILTPNSRKVLNQALLKPVRESGTGSFEGVVREIDLDARRFEIRRVRNAGTIRCVYSPDQHELVRKILDAQIKVSGNYEALADQQPRLVAVNKIEVIKPSPEQMGFELPSKK